MEDRGWRDRCCDVWWVGGGFGLAGIGGVMRGGGVEAVVWREGAGQKAGGSTYVHSSSLVSSFSAIERRQTDGTQ